ncbi:hypothetical protein [Lactobacillus gigeriorum]|uniref:Uncharacterized protein n=1 Tax=Lactobacillus gigeriorum DSM 23908 = CRBIP 24.85 TaxID=1423751 RepID=I7J3P5_9LACO|nr:hypothetical protein [Lactobacillus gigeriorum]KRN10901.1 hypothetical protein FC38_GL000911 [Lactobacillus gigeriorum DSM 23908 = CRBIP 24.85]CCI87907.1 Putative uncharacterized protein [Lactobacillus gigeriorum DSM 23908 = CRBIP 24.85]
MKITNKTTLYSIWEIFVGKWAYVKQKDGSTKRLYIVDVDDEFDPDGVGIEQDIFIYNNSGSDDYGNGMLISDIDEINL